MPEIEPSSTPFEMEDARRMLRRAFREVTGSPLGRVPEGYLMAILALEHDHGRASYQYNLGNVITTNESLPYFQLPGAEGLLFRAYPDFETSARAYIKTLLNEYNRPAFDAATRDDFDTFVEEIGKHYTPPIDGQPQITPKAIDTYRQLIDKYSRAPEAAAGGAIVGSVAFAAVVGFTIYTYTRKKR